MLDFQRFVDNSTQLCLKYWSSLPDKVGRPHIQLFHLFQQYVEFQEAAVIQANLSTTSAQNVEPKSNELKGILAVWRDRLPNVWDDINIWSDLVAWRQHVFGIVNKTYMPLLPALTQAGTASVPQSSFAYRGYHETAWIINRFANVARKHKLFDVCVAQLTKIYTLPNIEIHEAFYKLREQAKCFVMTPSEWPSGLDVVNNTNLMYFGLSQRAEFFSLKGIFLSKLKMHEEAVTAFSSATQIDVNLPQAWAAWGSYNDMLFNEAPAEKEKEALVHAADAVNCYMHASGLYNSAKGRKYLARVLWLLSVDNDEGVIAAAYDGYKGDSPVWYWIGFIPQLLVGLSGRESGIVRQILMKLAKNFPQSLHFQLRSTKEELMAMKKQHGIRTASQPDTPEAEPMQQDGINVKRHPWEYVDEIMGLLKTAFPLLALSMETMCDQIINKLKPTTDEDIYRLILALLNDGVQVCSLYLTVSNSQEIQKIRTG